MVLLSRSKRNALSLVLQSVIAVCVSSCKQNTDEKSIQIYYVSWVPVTYQLTAFIEQLVHTSTDRFTCLRIRG